MRGGNSSRVSRTMANAEAITVVRGQAIHPPRRQKSAVARGNRPGTGPSDQGEGDPPFASGLAESLSESISELNSVILQDNISRSARGGFLVFD